MNAGVLSFFFLFTRVMVLVTLSYERARYGGHRSLPAHSAYTPGAFSRARHCCQVLQWQRLSDRLAVRVIVLYGGLLIEVNGKHDKQYCRHSTSLPLPRRLCDFTMRLHCNPTHGIAKVFLSVRPSVSQTRFVTKRKKRVPHATWKITRPSFLTRRQVDGATHSTWNLGQTDPVWAKTPIFN